MTSTDEKNYVEAHLKAVTLDGLNSWRVRPENILVYATVNVGRMAYSLGINAFGIYVVVENDLSSHDAAPIIHPYFFAVEAIRNYKELVTNKNEKS